MSKSLLSLGWKKKKKTLNLFPSVVHVLQLRGIKETISVPLQECKGLLLPGSRIKSLVLISTKITITINFLYPPKILEHF